MLDQLDLHTAVAGVKKYSWIKRLNQRSLEGTHFRLSHRGCGGQTLKCRCMKCNAVCGVFCAVCNRVVMEMTWFCRKCHHASHPHHALEWFTTERKCPVGECMCACGTNVAQNPRKKTNVKLSQRLGDLIRIDLNDFPRDSLSEVTEQEDVKTRQNITLPVERDILKLLESPVGQIEVRNKLYTVLFWLRFFRLFGPQNLHRLQQKQSERKSDLAAQRKAYALYYQHQGRQGKEEGVCSHNDEFPQNAEVLLDLVSAMENGCSPHDAQETPPYRECYNLR